MGSGKWLIRKCEVATGISLEGVCLTKPWCQSITIHFWFETLPFTEWGIYQEYATDMVEWIKAWYGGWKNCICVGDSGIIKQNQTKVNKKLVSIDLTGKVVAKDMRTSKTIFSQFVEDLIIESGIIANKYGLTFISGKRK